MSTQWSGHRRGALAMILALGFAGAAGCGDSHGRDDDGGVIGSDPDGGGGDASVVVLDGGRDAGPLAYCASTDARIETTVVPITSDTRRCDIEGTFFTGHLYAVVPRPDVAGIELDVDLCPDADADCRCGLLVSNVGADIAAQIPYGGLIVGEIGPNALRIDDEVACPECEDCVCVRPLRFYASDGFPDAPRLAPSDVKFGSGERVCAEPFDPTTSEGCYSVRNTVQMIEEVGPLAVVPEVVDLDEGQTGYMERMPLGFRVVRSNDAVCPGLMAEPPLPGPRAAWVAWQVSRAADAEL